MYIFQRNTHLGHHDHDVIRKVCDFVNGFLFVICLCRNDDLGTFLTDLFENLVNALFKEVRRVGALGLLALSAVKQIHQAFQREIVALCTLMGDFAIAQEGNVYDLNTIEGLHLDGAWWDQNANEDLAINNKLYFTTGSFDTTRFDSIRALYFNQQLIKDYNLTNPYEMVDNNEWTIDNFAAMLEAGVHDADGDGLWTDKDKYGWITYNEIGIDMLTRGCGVNYIDKDPETGYLIDGTDGEKLIDVYAKIYDMYWGGNDVFDIRQSRFTPYLRGKGDGIIQELLQRFS